MDISFKSVESAKAITFDNLNYNSVENVPGFEAQAAIRPYPTVTTIY
ncbi:MAG: hypothetical protein J1F20_05125 [Muribaculaceae bacterium]|nr:hypothetical protein [Muribaculaceae bacterium]